jgi:hypothetical protein
MNASVHPFFQRCFSARVREARIGPLHLDDVITRLPTYLAYLNTDESLLFLQALPDYGTFWQQLSTMPFSENALTLLRALLELPDNNGEKARAELTKQSAMLSSDQWQTVLEDNGQHLDALLALLSRSDTVPDFGEPLAQAPSCNLSPKSTTPSPGGRRRRRARRGGDGGDRQGRHL